MTDQEQREQAEVLMANYIAQWVACKEPLDYLILAHELLALKWPCEKCNRTGKVHDKDSFLEKWIDCPDCEGTGRSSISLLAVLARNQKLPRPPDNATKEQRIGFSSGILSIGNAGFRRIIPRNVVNT